jgi:poly [ADP-ribose] polymerase
MARKAAQKAPAASPLDGCTVAASGRFPSGVTQSALQARLTSLGAAFASSVSADTTHLIATEKDFESNSTKVKAAAAHNVPVVTLHWLDECETTGKFWIICFFLRIAIYASGCYKDVQIDIGYRFQGR